MRRIEETYKSSPETFMDGGEAIGRFKWKGSQLFDRSACTEQAYVAEKTKGKAAFFMSSRTHNRSMGRSDMKREVARCRFVTRDRLVSESLHDRNAWGIRNWHKRSKVCIGKRIEIFPDLSR